MKKYYFVILCVIVLIFLFAILFRLGYALNQQKNKVVDLSRKETYVEIKNEHTLTNTVVNNKDITKPNFNNEVLDSYIDNFLNTNECNDFKFSILYLKDNIVNIKLECNSNIEYNIFDLKINQFITLNNFIKNEEMFKEKVYNLLYLKYPKFVIDEVDILNSNYIIKPYHIELTSNTLNYGGVNLKINNNEIKDLLDYNMRFDKYYENEKYVLDKNKKTVAFTFDDGPSEYDLEIIDFLRESHSTATFFVVGSRLDNFERSVKYMIDNNMEIGNHSYDHKSLKKIDNESILYQVNYTNELIKKYTNKDVELLRPPYGAYKDNLFDLVDMKVITWNVDTLDWSLRNTKKIKDNILRDIDDGSIVLMHSLFEETKAAVKEVLPELYKMGYQVVSVSELAKLKNIELKNDMVYRSLNIGM